MADGKEGGEYIVKGVKVNANGEPLTTTKDAVALETPTETVQSGTDVVAGSDAEKATRSKKN